MKQVMITLQLPEKIDNFYRSAAKRRVVSKSAVIREVLMEHVREKKEQECAEIQSEKTP